MKIGICQFSQETNTFSSNRYEFADLCPGGWTMPDELLVQYRGTGTYLGGAIAAADELGVTLVPIQSAITESGPLMTTSCLEYVLDTICEDLRKHVDELDGLYFAQHGGGSAIGHPCLETYAMERIRAVIGDLPMMSSLDMHCNISPSMIRLSDGLFPIKEFPHVDTHIAGNLAFKTLVRTIQGELRPVMSWVSIPQIYANTATCTLMSPMKEAKEYFAAYAKEHNLLDATICQGYSAQDQYWSGVSVLVLADRPAMDEARELAAYLWNRRDEFEPRRLTAEEAIREALAGRKDGYAIINESTDNPGSGCPGDSTHLLRELIKWNVPGSVYMNIYDPETAKQAHEAGVGAKISVKLGGKTEPICGAPVELDNVEILNLSNGDTRTVSPMNHNVKMSYGLSTRLRYRNVEIVVVSVRAQSIDDRPLLMTGADINEYQLICLKSAAHFRGYFQERADYIVTAETPGLRSTDLSSYPFKMLRRPIYPLEKDGSFEFPEVLKIYKNNE